MSAVDSRVPPGGYRRREQEAKHRKATNPALKHWARILGSLRSTFSNLTPRLKTLVTRWKRGVYRVAQRPETALMEDSRGTVVRRIEHLQTFLTASGIDRLVGDYLTGATVAQLAEQYGVHRATVSAHMTRRASLEGNVAWSLGSRWSGKAPPRRWLDASDRAEHGSRPQGGRRGLAGAFHNQRVRSRRPAGSRLRQLHVEWLKWMGRLKV